MKRLLDKVCVVTGGAKGIGQAVAELFADEGAKVIALDVIELDYTKDNVEHMYLDVSDTAATKDIFEKIVEKYGKIDVLVNNAGITRDSLTAKMTDEMWNVVLNVNLKGMFNMVRYVGPHMQENGQGSIVQVSSIVGEYGNVGQANYAAAKAGVHGLTQTWAKEFARRGAQVRVNTISPGNIDTDMIKTVPEHILESMKQQIMLKRVGQPLELAKAVLFLASDDSSYITGINLSVNGGMKL